jgi:hypothetical protein
LRHKIRAVKIFFIILLGVLSVACTAQVTTTTIVGTVADTTGAVIPNAKITITNVDTNRVQETTSNGGGAYRADLLPPGNYSIAVIATGFQKYIQGGIALNPGETGRIDVKLSLGSVDQVIEVSANITLVNTVNAEIGQTVDMRQIQELPLVNREAYGLLDLTPGVQTNNGSGTTPNISFGAPTQITTINGGMDQGLGSVNYYLDGGPNMSTIRNSGNLLPNPDALEEFRVQTNSYSAQYGRFGGGIINTIIKSGTNSFHGVAFEFLRNDKLNANDWNSTLAKAPLRRNQFGFTLGGPIIKDKTFFFTSYAGLRQTTSALLSSAVVPTALELTGDFRSSAKIPTDPFNVVNKVAQPMSCNGVVGVLCHDRMDNVSLSLLAAYVPASNAPTNHWQGHVTSPYDTNEFLIKGDHALTDNHRLAALFFTTSGKYAVNSGGNISPYSMTTYSWRQMNANLTETWTISPNVVNQAWASLTRMMSSRQSTEGKSLADFGSTFTPQGPSFLPNIAITGYYTMGNQISAPGNSSNYYSLRDLITWTAGHHTIVLGGDLALDKVNQTTLLTSYGTASFSGTMTGNAFTDYLLGIPSSFEQDSPAGDVQVSWDTALFAQDDWHVAPRLTVNVGARWDVQTPPVYPGTDGEATYVAGQQSVVKPNALLGQLFPGDKGVTRGIVPVRLGHFSPRVGFAYDPMGDGKTSVRGAFGLFWGSVSSTSWNNGASAEPYAIRQTFSNTSSITGATLTDPYRNLAGGNPFPYKGGTWVKGGGISPTPLNFNWPYTYQMNFSVTRQVTASLNLMAAYVGTLTHDMPYGVDINNPLPYCQNNLCTGPTKSNSQLRRPDQDYGSISMDYTNQNAFYHGFQLSGTQRMSRHVSASSYYTFSKTLQDVNLGGSGVGGSAQDYANLAAERSRAATDVHHMFRAAIIFQPDYYYGRNRVLRTALLGWTIAPIVRLQSGSPFTVSNGVDANLNGSSTDRAEVVGNPHISNPSAAEWFNTAAFTQNAAGTVPVDGNSPLNFIDGPGKKNLDLALSRTFNIYENIKLQYRGEATNAFNIVNLSNPSATVATTTFGTITGAQSMRQIQMGLRLSF